MKAPVSLERLKELLHYDPETGAWTRRVAVGRHGRYRAGSPAGTINPKLGYVVICIDYQHYYGHRLAWLYMTGEWPSDEVDHKNLVRHDLRWENLREATETQNRRNRSVTRRELPRGVHCMPSDRNLRRPFYAKITVDHLQIHLGYFSSPEEAHSAYAVAAQKHFGEFSRLT
jgi:hypothetical protein